MIIYLMMIGSMSGCALLGQDNSLVLEAQTTQETVSSERQTDSSENTQKTENVTQNTISKVTEETPGSQELYVYVCGAVKKPGVYTFQTGNRICDAIEAAGGFSKKADDVAQNLAEPLVDGQQLYVPYKNEKKSVEQPSQKENSQMSALQEPVDAGQSKVNLNQATKEQLMTLPGIGEAKAQSILNYRQEKGSFTSVEEIMNIEGIKEGVFQNIKDHITVG